MTQCAAVDLLALAHDVLDQAKGAGRRTASVYTSDFSGPALRALVETAVALAALPTPDRIALARRAEDAALRAPGVTNSSASLSVVPVAEREGAMERDHWYSRATTRRGPSATGSRKAA